MRQASKAHKCCHKVLAICEKGEKHFYRSFNLGKCQVIHPATYLCMEYDRKKHGP